MCQFGSVGYWTMNDQFSNGYVMYCRRYDGWLTTGPLYASLGIRPVVEMNEGVYIASGNGTEASPYILAKE